MAPAPASGAPVAVGAVGAVGAPVPDWDAGLAAVLADPQLPALHAQPVVELTGGTVAGFELLARFPREVVQAPPDAWFAAAERRGLAAALQERVLVRALLSLGHLPPNTFLSVNVDPHLVEDERVQRVLTSGPRLDRLVIELTEHTQAADLHVLDQVVAAVRSRGALVAVDDAGTGYAGLTQLLRLRPDVVKVDRELVSGVDSDPVKRAMVDMLGDLAGRMDAWVLTEGIETRAELEVLLSLGVPLGQGYYLARPEPRMTTAVAPHVVEQVVAAARRRASTDAVARLVRRATTTTERGRRADVLVDADSRPVGVDDGGGRSGAAPLWRRATVVAPGTAVREAAVRAASRDADERCAPLVCTDGQGRVVGVVTLTDLLLALGGSSPDAR